jgi:hypothetical protein
MSYAMRRPFGTRLIGLFLPGTDVPGYRLSRPYGTAEEAGEKGANRLSCSHQG